MGSARLAAGAEVSQKLGAALVIGLVVLGPLAWLAAGCSLPSAELHKETCTSDGSSSLERIGDPGPDCNGTRYADECAAAGLPSAYGVEAGCKVPATWAEPLCRRRKAGLSGCVPFEGLLCCPP